MLRLVKRTVLASASAALVVSATAAFGSELDTPADAAPVLEMPLARTALTLSIGGAHDSSTGGDETLRSGWISARGSTMIAGAAHVGADGARAWGIIGGADAQLFGIDLPVVEGARQFFRLGLSLSGFYVSPDRNLYWLDAGAFVAEQGSLLGAPTVRPRVLALGTIRTSETLILLYGAGYTYDFGRGLPLPFLGLDWRFAPAWRLDMLLPVSAQVTWRAANDISLGGRAAITGDVFDYQPLGTTGSDEARLLQIARFRLGVFARYALSSTSYLRLDVGVEGTRIDTGGAVERANGGYLQLAFGLGSAGPAAYDPAQLLNGW
jgi:hypothetical protein